MKEKKNVWNEVLSSSVSLKSPIWYYHLNDSACFFKGLKNWGEEQLLLSNLFIHNNKNFLMHKQENENP